jgi:hypothetical protein
MIIATIILISFIIGFGMGILSNIQKQAHIHEQYYNTVKSVIHEYLKDSDRVREDKYILPKNKIELLAAKIVLAIRKVK